MKKSTRILLILTFVLILPLSGQNADFSAVLLNPAFPDEWFWRMVTDVAKEAAEDLNIDLEVLYSNRDHLLTLQQAEIVLSREAPPDYLLIGNEKGIAGKIIDLTEDSDVKVFLFSNGFVTPEDKVKYQNPRRDFRNWIGQYIPDNYMAGYKMGKALIEKGFDSELVDSEGKLHIIAVAGEYNTHASDERIEGLQAAIGEYEGQVVLDQIVNGDWSQKTSCEKSLILLQRHQNAGLFWGANDATAFGGIEAAEKLGIVAGRDMLFGGCGWHEDSLSMIRSGELTVTTGGHFFDGAWVLIMLFDYFHGIALSDAPERSSMYALTKNNIDDFAYLFDRNNWKKIDFLRFSKYHNPSIEHYSFDLESVIPDKL